MQISAYAGMQGTQQMQQMHQRMFEQADADDDGALTLDEFKSIGQNMPAGASKPAGAPSADEMFADRDGDGKLTTAEMQPPPPPSRVDPSGMTALLEAQGENTDSPLLSLFAQKSDESEDEASSTDGAQTTGSLTDLLVQLIDKFNAIEQLLQDDASTASTADLEV